MQWFKNMKIRSKMITGFVVLLIATIGISIYGGLMILSVDSGYSRALNYPTERVEILNDLALGLMDARRTTNRAAMYIHDPNDPLSGIITQWYDVLAIRGDMNELFARFHANINADPDFTPTERAERIRLIQAYETQVVRYFDHYIAGLIVYARMFDESAAIRIVRNGVATVNRATAYHGQLLTLAQNQMVTLNANLSNQTATTVSVFVFIAIVSVIISFAVIMLVSNSITKPINRVVTALGDVASGRLNVNIDRTNISNDETGMLTKDVCGLIDVVKGMVDDLDTMYTQFVTLGNIHYEIDTAKYQNSFSDIMGLVNKLNTQVVSDIEEIIATVTALNDGDFNREMDEKAWVGEWVFAPKAINGMVANIKSINTEVTAMINAVAAKGDLSFNIDEAQYMGGWRKIMQGLNGIVKSIDAPMQVTLLSLSEMQNGNFDLHEINKILVAEGYDVDANSYSGVFKAVIEALDATMIDVHSYIGEIEKILALMADGDMRNKIKRPYVGDFDLIKRSVNNISGTLNKTMSEISVASEQVLVGATQISTSASALATSAQEQASSVEELTASIDMINNQVQQNAASAMEADEISKRSTANAQEGNSSMKEMVRAMEQIKDSSGEISKIIKAIQDIAFQTNLLALNAAVEAARAGEHGKGFSVVAEEVRNLAGRSQQSATETTSLIETSNSRVESGSGIAESTSQSLDMIVANAGEVSALINTISIASKEQAEAISQISEGLSQISKITQSNSAVSEETAAASQELNSQADLLRQLVSFFKL